MLDVKQTDEYKRLDDKITELTFQRVFPHVKLSQTEWDELHRQICELIAQRNVWVAKQNA